MATKVIIMKHIIRERERQVIPRNIWGNANSEHTWETAEEISYEKKKCLGRIIEVAMREDDSKVL